MEYLALLVPAMTLAGLPLIDRLERWAVSADVGVESDDAGPSAPMSSGELG